MNRYHDMEQWLQQSRDPNLEISPMWLYWTFNFLSREKCLMEARKAMAVHMAISSKGCKNIKCSFAFFNKAKGGKIVPPPPITCWGDGSTMFDRL
jgi:hypothetical protein